MWIFLWNQSTSEVLRKYVCEWQIFVNDFKQILTPISIMKTLFDMHWRKLYSVNFRDYGPRSFSCICRKVKNKSWIFILNVLLYRIRFNNCRSSNFGEYFIYYIEYFIY